MPLQRMGPPPRSFAADAHCCIMVRVSGPPNTRMWHESRGTHAGSPPIVIPTTASLPACSEPSRTRVGSSFDVSFTVDLGAPPSGALQVRGGPGRHQRGSVLEAVKGWPAEGGARGWAFAAATLDRFCARRQRAAMPERPKEHVQ